MRSSLAMVSASCLSLVFLSPVRADDAAATKAIIDKAIKAHGGAENVTKFKAGTAKMKGKVEVGGMTIEYNASASIQVPNKMRVDTDIDVMGQKFTFIQVINGDKGWIRFMDKTMDMDKDQVAEAQEQMYVQWVTSLAPLNNKEFKFSPLGEVKVGDIEAVGVQVSHKDRRDVSLFFDKKTGLLVKSETRSKDVQGGNGQEFTAETIYSGHKEFNGTKHATKHILKRDGKDFGTAEVTEYTSADKLDDSTFAKP
ncbi:MAG: hypothetical protein K2R98_02835 [Gemmataceae bacterium]|nr:hypothetical protein [Gemmataceae bacterium]